MGCNFSKSEEFQEEGELQRTIGRNENTNENDLKKMSSEKMSLKELTFTLNSIRKNDAFLANKLLKNRQSEELLSIAGSKSSFLHYAAKFNSYISMEIFLDHIKKLLPHQFDDLLHAQDANGRTPAMVCALYDSSETLFILLNSGDFRDLVDNQGKNLEEICKECSKSCLVVYERMTNKKKRFVSLKSAIFAIQRVRKLNKLVKHFMKTEFENQHTRKLQAIKSHDPSSLLDISTNIIENKNKVNSEKEMIWCQFHRSPKFDLKFDKEYNTNLRVLKTNFLDQRSVTITINNKAALDDSFHRQNKAELINNKKMQFREEIYELQSDCSEESDTEGEELQKLESIEMTPRETNEYDVDDDTLFMFQRLSYLKSLQKTITEVPLDSQTYSVLQSYYAKSTNFRDPDFPADVSILGQNWLNRHNNLEIIWQRPHELFASDYSKIRLFDTIDPHDIEQGLLGVCYFLAAISAIAEFPSRIQKIFLNPDSNAHGVYGVTFYLQGVPTELIIDDYIPCSKQGVFEKLAPIFAKPKGNELWVLLLEKAWAKLFGNYSSIETGVSDEAFEFLLGVPSFLYLTKHQSLDRIWNKIYAADKKNYIISASTHPIAMNDRGLAASHTYSLISAHDIAGYRIVKLRNPWGRFEWNGDFADNSHLWTPEIKAEVGYVNADDGMFCMTIEDFQKYFVGYVIAEYNEDWNYSYIKGGNDPHHAEYFKFRIQYPTEVYFRIHQRNERFSDVEGYAPADFRIARVDENQGYVPLVVKSADVDDTAIFGHHSISPSRHHKLYLKKAGEYVVRVKMLWPYDKKRDFTLSAYSYHKINFEHIKPPKDFLQKLFIHIGRKSKNKEYLQNDCFIDRGFSGLNHYIYAENQGASTWTLTVNFPKLINSKIGKPHKIREDTLQLVLRPGDRKAAYLKIIDIQKAETYIDPIFTHKWE